MAEVWGNINNNWQAHTGAFITEENDEAVNVNVVTNIKAVNGWSYSGIKGGGGAYVDGGGTEQSWSGNVPANGEVTIVTYRKEYIRKTHEARTINYSGYVNIVGYAAGTSTCSGSFTINAKTHHTISFNANGGSGQPGNITKWYGEQITIPSTIPKRTNYEFLGWSATKNGSVAYRPGGSYWVSDANATYYAVWKLSTKPPTISSFDVYRCDSAGTYQSDGSYIKMTSTWSLDTSIDSTNALKSLVYSYKDSNGWHKYDAAANSGTKGTTVKIYGGYDASKSYGTRVEVTDKYSTVAMESSVGPASFILDLSADGKGIGIGQAAPLNGIAIYGSPLNLRGTIQCNDRGWFKESVALGQDTVDILYSPFLVTVIFHTRMKNPASWHTDNASNAIREGYRPLVDVYASLSTDNGAASTSVIGGVHTDGHISLQNRGGSSSSDSHYGSITYPVQI